MAKTKHIYVTYIGAAPEKVWNALIDGEATRHYWSGLNLSDWQPGSDWEHRGTESGLTRIVGKVIEVSKPSRLVVSWANPPDRDDPAAYSRVTYEIETYAGEHSKLTVTHDELDAGSEMEKGITYGWPLVLSNLKTFLETGKALPMWACGRTQGRESGGEK
jgi:uncharacterized protein YndB with AHSA1/START domain